MIHKAVALLSGGLDSTTLAYDLKAQGFNLHLLSFDYGQRHRKELEVASLTARDLNARHDTVGLRRQGVGYWEPLASILGPSSLTDPDTEVPDGHYAEESMRATVVPNRNAIMLSIAYGVAVAENARLVAFAAHAGDHAIYPDCRPEFVQRLVQALDAGNRWQDGDLLPDIVAPYVEMSKGDIAVLAHTLGVPIADTWSCYKGGDVHCGTCGTCYERREALKYAEGITGLPDPTTYLDATTMFEAPHA
jgi:7-cyano-7-deazaguanine synthase